MLEKNYSSQKVHTLLISPSNSKFLLYLAFGYFGISVGKRNYTDYSNAWEIEGPCSAYVMC